MPTASSVARLRPLDRAARLGAGFWGDRRRVNGARSIPAGLRGLAEGGQLDDLRRAAGTMGGPHTGRPYGDSDVYKMAEALAWQDSPSALHELIDLVRAAQEPDGYAHSLSRCTGSARFADLLWGHEMYDAGHLIQAGIAEARTLGPGGLLAAGIAFADHLVETFGGRDAICGHPQIELALVELFRLTGERRFLTLAARMVDLHGHGLLGGGHRGPAYYQDAVPVRAATTLDGHCVRAFYLAAAATDVHLETGDPDLLRALERQWADTVATKTYLTGGVGCRRKTEAFGAPFELPPDQAFNETCAGVASVFWSWRMLLATGHGRYADHVERVLFNVVAAGVSLSGEAFSYVNTLHRRAAAMELGDKAPWRKPWFRCACCPPNVMRLLASLGHYLATVDGDGLQLHQYATATLDGAGLRLAVRTAYPWQGTVDVAVQDAPAEHRTLRLRLPGWCGAATLSLNDSALPTDPDPSGYLAVTRQWRPGDRVRLDLAMPARFTWPDPRIDAVRGCAAIERGPMVYCLEEADQPGLDDVVLRAGMAARSVSEPDLLGGTVTVRAEAWHRRPPPAGWPYGAAPPDEQREPCTVTAIPYALWDNRGMGQMRVWVAASR
jgi:hypothetical protein